jgi:hypothetical protein
MMADKFGAFLQLLFSSLRASSGVEPGHVGFDRDLPLSALYDPEADFVHLSVRVDYLSLDFIFSVAHEWRHVWQFKCCPSLLDGYLPRDRFSDLGSYNMQPAEIDANAWAWLFVKDFAGLSSDPTFPGLGKDVFSAISKRKAELEASYVPCGKR